MERNMQKESRRGRNRTSMRHLLSLSVASHHGTISCEISKVALTIHNLPNLDRLRSCLPTRALAPRKTFGSFARASSGLPPVSPPPRSHSSA